IRRRSGRRMLERGDDCDGPARGQFDLRPRPVGMRHEAIEILVDADHRTFRRTNYRPMSIAAGASVLVTTQRADRSSALIEPFINAQAVLEHVGSTRIGSGEELDALLLRLPAN